MAAQSGFVQDSQERQRGAPQVAHRWRTGASARSQWGQAIPAAYIGPLRPEQCGLQAPHRWQAHCQQSGQGSMPRARGVPQR